MSEINLQCQSIHKVYHPQSKSISVLPDTILGTLFSFATYPEVAKNYHPVSTQWKNIFPVGGTLDLRNSTITDETLEEIINNLVENRVKINSINLSGCTNITDKGLEALKKLNNLRALDLSGCTRIQSFDALSSLKNLNKLDLSGCTQIEYVEALSHLTNLNKLYLNGCTQIKSLEPLAL